MKKIILGLLLGWVVSCENDNVASEVVLVDQSVTPVLLKKKSGFEKLELFSLVPLMMFCLRVLISFLEDQQGTGLLKKWGWNLYFCKSRGQFLGFKSHIR
jgi:hypothetical protein